MAVSSKHTGWRYDAQNSRLDFYYQGTRVGHINTAGMTIPSGEVLDLTGATGILSLAAGEIAAADLASNAVETAKINANAVTKGKMDSGVYTIEHIVCLVSATDNEILGISKVWNECTVVRVVYWTSGALGGGFGIDILDGGASGSGSTVIDSSTDNLTGFDSSDLSTPYTLSAGDYVRIEFDNFSTAPDYISVDIQLKVPLTTNA